MTQKVLVTLIIATLVFLTLDLYTFFGLPFSGRYLLVKKILAPLWFIDIVLFWVVSLLYRSGNSADYKVLVGICFGCLLASLFGKVTFAIFLIIEDIVRLFFLGINALKLPESPISLSRRKFVGQIGLVIAAIPFGTLLYGIRNGYNYKVRNVKIPLANIPEALRGLRIVQISDIHSGSLTNKAAVQRGVDLINEQKGDVILFTGDLVNIEADEIIPLKETFSQLSAPLGVHAVLGNHDYADYADHLNKEERAEEVKKLMQHERDMGWNVLHNEHVTLEYNNTPFNVVGIGNWSAKNSFHTYGDLTQATSGMPSDTTNILMSHDPSHWEAEVVPKFPNMHLTLAGHTHGMQLGVEYKSFRWSPSKWMYKQWADLYQKGEQYIYVNRGFGFNVYPGRVGILPEITVIELV